MTSEATHHDTELPKSDLLKIGDFARLAGTNLRTLRYYEEMGLLAPASRSKGGFRFYRKSDVNRLATVSSLQDLGLSLEEIRELITTRVTGQSRPEFLGRVRTALEAQGELFEARMAELQARRARIETALEQLVRCETCDVVPAPDNNHCEPCSLHGRELPADLSALF